MLPAARISVTLVKDLTNTFGVFVMLAASVTYSNAGPPPNSSAPYIVRIGPPLNWFEMCLNEDWQYRELP